MEEKVGSISTCLGIVGNQCHKVSYYETRHKSMNFLILPWITDPPARPPAVYIKLGIHQSLSLLLYLRMEAHTLKTVWLWRSVGACAHKRVEEPSVLGCLLWSVLQRQDFLIIFSFLNICLSLEPPKTIA